MAADEADAVFALDGVVLAPRGSLAPAHAPRSEVARQRAEKAWLRIGASVAHFARIVDPLLAIIEAMHVHRDDRLLAKLGMKEAPNRATGCVFNRVVVAHDTR
jgi:hypothetical protein